MDRLDHPDADSLPDDLRFASNGVPQQQPEDSEPAPAKAKGRRKKRKGHHGGMQVHAHNCQPACMQPMMAAQVPMMSVGYAMPLSCCVGVGCHCQPTTEEEDAEDDDDVCEGRKGAVAGTEVWCKCNKKEQPISDASVCVNPGGGRGDVCKWDAGTNMCKPKPGCPPTRETPNGSEKLCCKVPGVGPKLMCKCRGSGAAPQIVLGLDKCKGQNKAYGWKGDARADWGSGRGEEV